MTGNRVKKTGDTEYIPHVCVCIWVCKTIDQWLMRCFCCQSSVWCSLRKFKCAVGIVGISREACQRWASLLWHSIDSVPSTAL